MFENSNLSLRIMNKIIFTSAFLLFFMFIGISYAQTEAKSVNDSIVKEVSPIKASEVPSESGELLNRLQKINEVVPTSAKITAYANRNDSLEKVVDSLLFLDESLDLSSQTTRYLNNRLVFWRIFSDKIKNFNSELTKEIATLDANRKKVNKSIAVWRKTKMQLKTEDSNSGLLPRINTINSLLDSTLTSLNKKSDALLVILNSITAKGFEIQNHIQNIDDIYVKKKSQIFVQNEPSVFSLEYRNRIKTSFIEPIKGFYETEIIQALTYVKQNALNVVFQIILLIVLMYLIGLLSNKLKEDDYDTDSTYSKYLVRIVSRRVSSALVLAVFLSIVIFPNRQEVLKDFLMLVITIPVIVLAKTIVNKAFHSYLNIFGILIVLNTIYIIFPPDNIFYMIIMLFTAIMEIYVLWKVFWYFYRSKKLPPFLNGLIVFIVGINLGFSTVGLFGLLYGSTTLADLCLNMPFFSAYSGFLIFISMIILNGLISFFFDSNYANKLNVVGIYGGVIKKRILAIINISMVLIWLSAILNLLNIRREIIDGISNTLTYEIVLGSASFTIGNVLLFFLVIWLSIVISKIIKALLVEDVFTKIRMAKGLPHTIAIMVRYAIITVGVLLAISAVGMPLSSITVLAGAFGIGIGFGLQSIFNNIVSGFILLFERPIQIGDTIEVGSLIGTVKSIGIRASNIRTFDGADIIVPNGELVSNQVVNWTLSDQQRRIEVLAGVAYGSDPHKVKELFEKVLAEHKDILKDPSPTVYFNGLGNSSLDFRLLFWTPSFAEWLRIKSEIIFGVHDILYKEGISIPFPQMDLHLKSIDTPLEVSKKEEK